MCHDGVRGNYRVTADCNPRKYNGTDPDPTAISQGHGTDESIALIEYRCVGVGVVVIGVADKNAIGYQDVASNRHAAPRVDLCEATDRRAIANPQRRHTIATLVFGIKPSVLAEDDIATDVNQFGCNELGTPAKSRSRTPCSEPVSHDKRVAERQGSVEQSKHGP
jgi:hypothetical protein